MRQKYPLTIGICFIILVIVSSFVLAKEGKIGETEEEKLARMLRAFDDPSSYHKGVIVVVFTQNTTKEISINLLNNYNLTLQQVKVCGPIEGVTRDVNEGESGGGEPTSEEGQTCVMEDKWDNSLKLAHAIVPEGEEKKYAEILIKEKRVTWIEPEYIVTTLGEDEPTTEQSEQQEEQKKSDEEKELNYLYYIIPIVVVLLIIIIFILKRRKK